MRRKWWIIAAIFALALSLTSCSRRGFMNYGENLCNGTMGQIWVYTVSTPNHAGTYQIIVEPYSLAAPGDVATVTAVNRSTLAYKTILQEVVLNNGQQVTTGFLNQSELMNYDLIAITSYVPAGVDFLAANPAKDTICARPLVGDRLGVNQPQSTF